MTEPLDNPATPDADHDTPALWPPAGTTVDESTGALIGPDGDELPDPPDHEAIAEEDPPAEETMSPDAGQPLDDIEEGEDIGDEDLDGDGDEDEVTDGTA